MDAAQFVAPEWGRAVNTGGRFGYVAFRPEPLPRELALHGPTVLALSDADAALGRRGCRPPASGTSPAGDPIPRPRGCGQQPHRGHSGQLVRRVRVGDQ